MSPKEEATALGGRFRDMVMHAFTIGKRAGELTVKNPKNGMAAVMFMEAYVDTEKLWEEVLEFMRKQIEEAKPKSAPVTNGVKR